MRALELIAQLSKAAVALPVTIVLLGPHAFAQDSAVQRKESQKVSYGAETDFNSAYVWRGILVNNRPLMQPSAWISVSGFTLTAWRNLALTNTSDNTRLQVADVILKYGRDWKKLRIEPTIETYLNRWPEDIDGANTIEASLNLSYQLGPLRVFNVHSFDILAYRGSYFGEAGLGYEGHVTRRTGLAVYIRTGWASSEFNDVYIGLDQPALNFIGVESSLTYYVRPYLYLRPHFEFSNISGRRLRGYLSSPAISSFGLAVGVEF